MKLVEIFGKFTNVSHIKSFTLLKFSYWEGNIIIFSALFNNFFFCADTYYYH